MDNWIGWIIGVVGIGIAAYSLLRHRRGALSLVPIRSLSLVDDILSSLPDLEVTFREVRVGDQLFLFEAVLVNSGPTDIVEEMVKAPVALELPTGSRWLDPMITATTKGLNATLNSPSPERLEIGWLMFRPGESIRLKAMAELNSLNGGKIDLLEHVKATHRIKDTNKIDVAPPAESAKSWIFDAALMFAAMLFVPALITYVLMRSPAVGWGVVVDSGPPLEANLFRTQEGGIEIRAEGREPELILASDDLAALGVVTLPADSELTMREWILGIAMLLLMLGLQIASMVGFFQAVRRGRFRKAVRAVEVPSS